MDVYLELAKEQVIMLLEKPEKETGDQKRNWDHSTVKINLNTKKSPGDLLSLRLQLKILFSLYVKFSQIHI